MLKIIFLLLITTLTLFANNFKDLKSYQATFTQSIVNNSGKQILYKGDIFIQEPSQILWKYTDPIVKDVYINNSQVTIIEPELEQAIISKLQNEINIIKLLKEATYISKDKYIANFFNTDYTLTIENNIFKQIQYKDQLDNNITISFSNIKQNKTIEKNTFKFNIPYDYDIIRK